MNIIEEIRVKCYPSEPTDEEIKNNLQLDYNDLVDLRNRLSNDTEHPHHNEIYEEDHLILDHILDYLEILLKLVDKDKIICYNRIKESKEDDED